MASAARVGSLNSANAKPRGRPVTRSFPSRTRTAESTSASTAWSSSSVVSKDRLPTKIVDEMGCLLLESSSKKRSSLRGHRRPLEEDTAGHHSESPFFSSASPAELAGWIRGGRRQVVGGHPALEPVARGLYLVARAAWPPRPPGEDLDLGAVRQAPRAPIAEGVGQRHTPLVARAVHENPP